MVLITPETSQRHAHSQLLIWLVDWSIISLIGHQQDRRSLNRAASCTYNESWYSVTGRIDSHNKRRRNRQLKQYNHISQRTTELNVNIYRTFLLSMDNYIHCMILLNRVKGRIECVLVFNPAHTPSLILRWQTKCTSFLRSILTADPSWWLLLSAQAWLNLKVKRNMTSFGEAPTDLVPVRCITFQTEEAV